MTEDPEKGLWQCGQCKAWLSVEIPANYLVIRRVDLSRMTFGVPRVIPTDAGTTARLCDECRGAIEHTVLGEK